MRHLLVRLVQRRQPRDQHAITRRNAECLAELLFSPIRYSQRFVECLSFLPRGGQHWTRTLQIRLPMHAKPASTAWRIISLGPFSRRRFADITVTNRAGERVDLLTRAQHGASLTKATITKHVYSLPAKHRDGFRRIEAENIIYVQFWRSLRDYYTDISNAQSRESTAHSLLERYEDLLLAVGLSTDEINPLLDRFSDDLVETLDTTHYLCWVRAEPGEVINLEVAHTTVDPNHKLAPGSLRDLARSIGTGLFGGDEARRAVRSNWCRQYGLTPINYEFNVPTTEHTGSYYFTLKPPANTNVTYLDWEEGNSIYEAEKRLADESHESDCGLHSAHIHNADRNQVKVKDRRRTIRAYLRCTPHHHKQILGAILLNLIVVWLLARGRLPGRIGDPLQGILVAAPSILIAYLVRQQRHYYAHAMRRQRLILWIYLSISVLFLVAVAFSEIEGQVGSSGLGKPATAAAWLLAVSSVAVFFWNLPLGHGLERMVDLLTKRKFEKTDPEPGERWVRYEESYGQYSRWTMRMVIASIVATSGFLALTWDFPPEEAPVQDKDSSVLVKQPHP